MSASREYRTAYADLATALENLERCPDTNAIEQVRTAIVAMRIVIETQTETLDNLTWTQNRCSELLNENRFLHRFMRDGIVQALKANADRMATSFRIILEEYPRRASLRELKGSRGGPRNSKTPKRASKTSRVRGKK